MTLQLTDHSTLHTLNFDESVGITAGSHHQILALQNVHSNEESDLLIQWSTCSATNCNCARFSPINK